jgi:hypothetical protein
MPIPIPKVTKPRLREAAELALRERGYEVKQVQARGVRPGTRVQGIKDGAVLEIAVRSSLNREVSLLKNQSGSWRTVPHVDEVVVAAADADDASMVEVLGFDRNDVIAEFDKVVAAMEKAGKRKSAYEAPVFLSLDKEKDIAGEVIDGLKSKAIWRSRVSLTRLVKTGSSAGNPSTLTERIERKIAELKLDLAELNAVDVDQVSIDVRIAR